MFIIDTVGTITLPSGETVQGVILTTDDPEDIRAAGRHWAGQVTIAPVEEETDEDLVPDDAEPLDPEPIAVRDEQSRQSLIGSGHGHLLGEGL